MLVREEFKTIEEGIKIKNLTGEELEKLTKQVNKVAKKEDGEIDYDNPDAMYIMFKKLIVSDIKEIKNINKEKFIEAYYNPSYEMETICYEIGRIMMRGIVSHYRKHIVNLQTTELQLLQAEAIMKLNNVQKISKELKELQNVE